MWQYQSQVTKSNFWALEKTPFQWTMSKLLNCCFVKSEKFINKKPEKFIVAFYSMTYFDICFLFPEPSFLFCDF